MLKALEILSDTTVRRSVVDQEDLKNLTGKQKKGHISLEDQQSCYLQALKIKILLVLVN